MHRRLVGFVAVCSLAGLATALGGCACPTPCAPTTSASEEPRTTPQDWRRVDSEAALARELACARSSGTPVVVEVWADWCTYCRDYHDVIDGSPRLRRAFGGFVRLRIDVSDDGSSAEALRTPLGIPRATQPYLAFFDASGARRLDLDLDRWHGSDSEVVLADRVDRLRTTHATRP